MKRWEPYFWPIGAAAFVLALWQLAVAWIHPLVFPSPLNVLHAIEEQRQPAGRPAVPVPVQALEVGRAQLLHRGRTSSRRYPLRDANLVVV